MLIIEDGTIIANANSYTTDAELVAYAAARGLTIDATESARDILQIKATDFLEGKIYIGSKVEPDNQYLMFPRSNVYAFERTIDSDEIPRELKYAQMEAAIAAYSQSLLVNSSENNTQRETLGSLEVEYFSRGSSERIRLDRVNNYLSPFLANNSDNLIRT